MVESSKSIFWINAVKAICIISVFFVHSQSYSNYGLGVINTYVHPFYVNGFFFVSGYLLFRKQLSSPLIDETKLVYMTKGGRQLFLNVIFRIVIPSTLFALMEFFPKKLMRGLIINYEDLLFETIGGGTYWFTSALAVSEIIILLMLFSRKKSILFYFSLCICVFVFGTCLFVHKDECNSFPNYWAYKQGLLAILFLGMGGLYWKYEHYIDILMRDFRWICIFFAYIVLEFFFKKQAHVLISMLSLNVLGVLSSCLAILLLIQLCKKLPSIQFLTYIGRYSICFYFLSGALPIVLSSIGNRVFSNPSLFLFVFFGSFFSAFCMTYLLYRYIPWIFDLRVINKYL